MSKAVIMHIDEAPWIRKRESPPGDTRQRGSQLIGDLEKGPWIYINSSAPGFVADAHIHSQNEVIYILEGEMTVGDTLCGPGTIVSVEKDTEYGFTAGPEGVRFLNIREGLATTTFSSEGVPKYT